jgi:hypothetical protein
LKAESLIIGKSPIVKSLLSFIEKASKSDLNVLILGETGVGKELEAMAIHDSSNREDKPFIKINCGNLNDNLLESKLFGHRKDAFKGAFIDRPGLIESANGGTFFFDEIGDVNPYLQEAVANFKKAGLIDYVDARLADAHELVPRLSGPFDFVFCDADKDWYPEYLKAAWPKLAVGGCFTAHNVLDRMSGIREFLDYASSLTDGETTIDHSSGSGISMTFKLSGK